MLNFYCYICGKTFKKGEETKMTVLGAVHTTCLEKKQDGFIEDCVRKYNDANKI